MKKILLLLLLATFSIQAQTLQNPTYGNVKLKNNTTDNSATKVNVQSTDGTINTISKADLVNVVEVNDVPSLPLTGVAGKIYVVKNVNKIYRWNGTFYQELAGSDLNYQSIIDALTFTPENVANKATTLTASSTLYPNNDAVIAGLALKEDKSNKVTSIGYPANDTNYPSELAVKTYSDNLVVGMLNDRGTWDASGNVFPTTGGSGVGGVIRKGDMWYVSVAGTLGTKSVNVGDSFRALVNAPAQVAANWSILEANIGYVPANDSNVVHLTGAETITGVKTFNDIRAVTNYKSSTNNVIISDTDGVVFRGVRSGAWSDSVNSRFFQVGDQNDNVAFTTRFGSAANRMLFSSLKTQISSGSFVSGIIPLGIFEVTNGSNRFFNVFESGNSVFGGSTDDNINRLQVAGTISSGTTALGNTPPTANNQLTRKDYVDTGLALKANSASPALTGTPTAPTATAGTNTTQIATMEALQTGLGESVKLTGNQTISGQKSFSLTGKIDMQTDNAFPAIMATTLGSNGKIAAQFINNSSSPNSTALMLQTGLSGGVGNRTLSVSNYTSTGTGIVSNASNGGVSISSQSGDGDSYISNITYGGTGRNYVGRNDGTETYSVDKIGNVIGNSYIKRSTPATNILLAGGGDIAQNTAFNKNFGTTAGTVAEGNDSRINNGQTAFGWGNHVNGGYAITTGSNINQASFRTALGLGSNAYTSTAYLPLTGGIINGSLAVQNSNYTTFSVKGTNTGNNGGGLIRFENQDTLFGEIAVETESAGNGVIYLRSLTNGVITQKASIASSGAATFASTVTAAPATASNHVVVKSQLDAYLPLSGGTITGNFKLNGLLLSDNFTGGNPQVLNPTATVLYLGNPNLINVNYETGTRHQFYVNNSVKGTFNSEGLFVDGTVTATSLPVFENNAAASSLAVGQFYRTSIGVLMVKF